MPPQPKALRQPLASPCLNISIPAIPLPSSPAAAICWQLRLICQAPSSELTLSQIRRCLRRSFSRVSLHSPHRPNRFALFLANAAAPAATRGYLLARKSLVPVADMTAQADHIGESTIHDRLPIQNPHDELGRLAATFNRLLDRLDAAFERQRRFIADASHELRTPLAILQGESEVALSKEIRSTDEYRESLGILHQEARRLSLVVDDMFTLSRADAGQYPVTLREFYLDELVADCVQSLRSLAAAKSISLSINSDRELPIVADESLVRRMLLNLLDNSIKYSPSGGTVAVTARAAADTAVISLADNGPGISSELQSRIFERFFRGDQARTRSNPQSGAGLGLSIAKWIAEAHHGTLELSHSGSAGTVFTARIPKSPAPSTRTD